MLLSTDHHFAHFCVLGQEHNENFSVGRWQVSNKLRSRANYKKFEISDGIMKAPIILIVEKLFYDSSFTNSHRWHLMIIVGVSPSNFNNCLI